MNFLRRIQCMGFISPLFILFISFIEPNRCLVRPSNEVMITGAMPLTVSNVHYKQNRDSLSRGINDTVSYPGGEAALQQFLFNNNIFNSSESGLSIDLIVYLRLSIDSNGFVNNKTILRSEGGEIDKEALRLADLLVFNPATDLNGKTIASEYILKVCFNKRLHERVNIDCAMTIEIDEFERLYFRNGPASYPGGKRNMKRYFSKNLAYPNSINENYTDGKVKLLIFINRNGYISVVHVIDSPDQRLNEEAIRLVKSVSRWKPVIRNNNPTNGFLTVDVKFKKAKRQ